MGAIWQDNEDQLRNQKLIKNIRIHGPGRIKYNMDSIDIILDENERGSLNSASCLPAKIVSKTGAFYLVDIYANGYDSAVTINGVIAKVLSLNYAETLPAGTEVVVLSSSLSATGGD